MNKRIRKVPPKSEFRDALILNNETEKDYLYRMKKIVTSMFEWDNLPDSMNERFLEESLFYDGQAALLFDDNFGYVNTRATSAGYINIYGLPTEIHCWSFGYDTTRSLYLPNSGEEKNKECILVMNNRDRVPTAMTIGLFAYRLANLQRAIDANISASRTPLLLTTDQKQLFTLKKMYEQYDANTPAIFADKNLLSPDSIKAINTEVKLIVKDLNDAKREVWNEFLTSVGISNLNEKRERMISAETDSNNEVVNMNLQSFLIPRQQACKEFNEKYGLMGDKAINVRVRSDLYNIVKQYDSISADYDIEELQGGKDGSI